jgi:hypothetical protein
MDTLNTYPTDELDDSIPDSPHVEIMFDALNDTVSGTEGMVLTPTQIYAAGVLGANNYRAGNEGFFGSIASGAKAVWDYIVKMFKSVWEFFFNRDAAAEVKEAKQEVQANAEALVSAGASVNAEGADKAIAKAKTMAHAIENGEHNVDPQKTRDWLASLVEGEPAERKAAAEKVVKEIYSKIGTYNEKGGRKVKAAAEKVVRLNSSFLTWFEKEGNKRSSLGVNHNDESAAAKTLAESFFSVIKKFVEHHKTSASTSALSGEIKTLDDGKHIQTEITASIEALGQLIRECNAYTGKIKGAMSDVEKQLGSTKPGSDGHDKHTKELQYLRGIMSVSAAVATYIKKSIEAEKEYSNAINKMFFVHEAGGKK